jgi:cephalosporin-C deacetylase-like acetyl esterase
MKKLIRYKELYLFSILLLVIIMPVYSQENLDVLPVTNRNELFHDYLVNILYKNDSIRKEAVEVALSGIDKLIDRQNFIRNSYLHLLGTLPEKTPLNPVIVDTLEGTGYIIEKLAYESVPNHHVTANFYIPATGTAPYPAVLVTIGHYPEAKGNAVIQNLCILLATNGIAALAVDPICQGERNQIQDPNTGALLFAGQSGTAAHSRLDVGACLAGTSVVAYELWDNCRGIDYLYSRTDVVDTSRIGNAGSSGGGAQGTYLAAFDPRIKVSAIASFIMNEPTLFSTIGPQTGSQNLSYEGLYSIDHPDYITMFAPKPFMILAASKDFFDTTGTHQTYEEMKKVYQELGVPEKIGYFESNDEHDYTKPKREAAVRWFRTWFYNDTNTITEPTQTILSTAELQVTETGQVVTAFENEKTVTELSLEMADNYKNARVNFWSGHSKQECLDTVRNLIRLAVTDLDPQANTVESVDRGNYTIEKLEITNYADVPVTGLLFVPKNMPGKLPGVLYIDGRGKKTDALAGGIIEKMYVDSGKVVLAVDVRGFGETTDNPSKNESKHGNNEHRNAVISLYNGSTLIGQRVADVMKAKMIFNSLAYVDTNNIQIAGIDRAVPVVLHAAAFDDSFTGVVLRKWSDSSWVNIVSHPTVLNNMTHVIPFALTEYDLPDLVNAIGPEKVAFTEEPVITRIEESKAETENMVFQNYPNPFSGKTTIVYTLPGDGYASIQIYDSMGRLIKTVFHSYQLAELHHIEIDDPVLQPGTYFCKLILNSLVLGTRKMVVLP